MFEFWKSCISKWENEQRMNWWHPPTKYSPLPSPKLKIFWHLPQKSQNSNSPPPYNLSKGCTLWTCWICDHNGIWTQNHLVCRWKASLAKMVKCLFTSGCGFESCCSHLNFSYCACFEQVPWHSGNYSVDLLHDIKYSQMLNLLYPKECNNQTCKYFRHFAIISDYLKFYCLTTPYINSVVPWKVNVQFLLTSNWNRSTLNNIYI